MTDYEERFVKGYHHGLIIGGSIDILTGLIIMFAAVAVSESNHSAIFRLMMSFTTAIEGYRIIMNTLNRIVNEWDNYKIEY